jgi:hypothetical protein
LSGGRIDGAVETAQALGGRGRRLSGGRIPGSAAVERDCGICRRRCISLTSSVARLAFSSLPGVRSTL